MLDYNDSKLLRKSIVLFPVTRLLSLPKTSALASELGYELKATPEPSNSDPKYCNVMYAQFNEAHDSPHQKGPPSLLDRNVTTYVTTYFLTRHPVLLWYLIIGTVLEPSLSKQSLLPIKLSKTSTPHKSLSFILKQYPRWLDNCKPFIHSWIWYKVFEGNIPTKM